MLTPETSSVYNVSAGHIILQEKAMARNKPLSGMNRVRASSVLVCCLLGCALLAACGHIAERTAPAKQARASRTDAAVQADALFWQTLHEGEYQEIPSALEALTGAYLANPNDSVTAAHIGWMHIWRLAERARLEQVPATITDDAALARRYFQEAVNLNPHEPRYLGFLAAATLAEGSIHKDEKVTRRGYYLMLDAVEAWPE